MSGRLAIDIGNTRIACAIFDNGELRDLQFHLLTDLQSAGHEISLFALDNNVREAAMSSVVPAAQDMLLSDLQRKNAMKIFVVDSESQPLLTNVYKGLGPDRIANASFGYKHYAHSAPAIVIDFGSATTLTAVSPQGKFLGGWITLGIGKTLAALNQGIAMLPDVQSKIESTKNFALGMNPEDAIIRGTLLAHAAAIDAWIDAARDELGLDAVVVATGGYSTKISPLCKRISNADPLLTLKGVDLIAEAAMGRADLV